jgi:hypothetical protein
MNTTVHLLKLKTVYCVRLKKHKESNLITFKNNYIISEQLRFFPEILIKVKQIIVVFQKK